MRKEDWNGYKVMIVRSQRMIGKKGERDDAGGAAGKGGAGYRSRAERWWDKEREDGQKRRGGQEIQERLSVEKCHG